MEAPVPNLISSGQPKVCVKRTQIMNKSQSSTDSTGGETRCVVVRSLSVSEPVDIELRRYQRKLEHPEPVHKRPDSPNVISSDFGSKKEWNNFPKRRQRGRPRRRFYEPSLERFPPPSITKSRLRVVQEMPFWRLNADRFRRTVSSFETRERRDAKWRQMTLQDMPFAHYPWKRIHKLFTEPDPAKIARRRLKENQKLRLREKRTASQENVHSEPKIKLKQRARSTSEKTTTSIVEGGVEIIKDTTPVASKESSLPRVIETDSTLATAKPPPIPLRNKPNSTSTTSVTTPSSIRTRVGGSECQSCDRRAYRAESIEALGQVFHSSCFRCAECSRVLQRGNWNHHDGKFYCNPCHRKLALLTFRH